MCPGECCVRLHFGMTTVKIRTKDFTSLAGMMNKALPEVHERVARTEALAPSLMLLKGGVPESSDLMDEHAILN